MQKLPCNSKVTVEVQKSKKLKSPIKPKANPGSF
jgi:hypothetical protein